MTLHLLHPKPTLRDLVLDPNLVNPVAHAWCEQTYGTCSCKMTGTICPSLREPAAFTLAVASRVLRERK